MSDPGKGVRWKLRAEAFRIWLPVVISICAISLTVFQAVSSRRHTRLSVQPRLDWRLEQNADTGAVTLRLVNVGFGPAVMTEVTPLHDGDDLGRAGPTACDALDDRLGRAGDDWDTACFSMTDDFVLRPGDEITVYGSRAAPDLLDRDRIERPIDVDKIGIRARYCSFYDDCWWLAPS